ncbi:MAG TPA: DUF4097 family beta strand repeat-containing protein [Gaiella sp.]|nr:DUF4097 family beta strand repeat-containing protein [Gaiella sp.]
MAEPSVHAFDAPGRVGVRVEIPAGSLSVEAWAEPRVEVEVAAARGDERSVAAAEETRVSAAERGGRHEIAVRAPKREGGRLGISWGRGPELAVTVRCPEGADLVLATHSADLETRGRLGAVSARTASGDATLEDSVALSYTTASGDLTAGAVEAALAVKSASGDVDVRSVGASAAINTVSGDVRLGETAGPVAVKTISGDVELGAVEREVVVSSVSGDVQVSAVPGLVLWIDAQSVSGTMSSELDLGNEPSEPGQDAVELRIRTVSGDVRVARGATATH